MFEDFSFASASRQRAFYDPFPTMDDGVSPSSSRDSTPCFVNGYNGSGRRYSISDSIAELSREFDQHTLTPRSRRPSVSRDGSTPRAREHYQHLQAPSSFSNRACGRRQSINRLQCSSTHLSRISALVENVVQTGQPLYDSTHPNAMLDDSTSPSLSPDEDPPSMTDSYFGFTPLASSSTSGGSGLAQHSLQYSQSHRIDKELRHSASRGEVTLVKKKIRVRKSSKSLSKGARKRCERDR